MHFFVGFTFAFCFACFVALFFLDPVDVGVKMCMVVILLLRMQMMRRNDPRGNLGMTRERKDSTTQIVAYFSLMRSFALAITFYLGKYN